jgi:hypothetical protein
VPPGIGTVPNYTSPVTPQTGVTAITNPGSIAGLLPTITPGASATSPTAGLITGPAADSAANPGTTTDASNASNSVLIVPVATAEKIGLILLLFLLALGLRLRLRTKAKAAPTTAPGRASDGAHRGLFPVRRLSRRRQHGDPPEKTR